MNEKEGYGGFYCFVRCFYPIHYGVGGCTLKPNKHTNQTSSFFSLGFWAPFVNIWLSRDHNDIFMTTFLSKNLVLCNFSRK